jgi:hypothetical protein
VLFEIVNLIFPLYVRTQHSQFGQFALLLALLTFWFWVLSLVLLLGAEMNSFAALGQRAAGGDLPTMLHDIQVHGRAPREGEDADAPPAGHPVSASGERIHARDRGEQAPTGEDAAHVPGDADRRSQPGAAAQEQRSASVANVAATEHDQRRSPRVTPSGSRSGQGLLALLATLLAVLSAVHRRDQPRVL